MTQLLKSLLLVVIIGASLFMLSFLTIHQPQMIGGNEDVSYFNPRAPISIKIEDSVVQNFSERLFDSLSTKMRLCLDKRKNEQELRTIYVITPTYKRPEQLPELTRLAQTLLHVPSLVWIVVEDAESKTPHVIKLLERMEITSVYLLAPMPKKFLSHKSKPRGVSNRNKGLEWIRENHKNGQGVVYFADDDNTYDIRLFDEVGTIQNHTYAVVLCPYQNSAGENIRKVKKLGMWPVGLVTSFGISSPVVRNGTIVGFYDGWIANRKFPVDMAGFGFSVQLLLDNPNAKMPYSPGYEEDGFLKSFKMDRKDIEPHADLCRKVYVWHTQAKKNKSPVKYNTTLYGSTNIEVLYGEIT